MANNSQERIGNLKIAGAPPGYSQFKVLACEYTIERPMSNGQPSGAPFVRNNCIKVTVETTKSVRYLRDWALDNKVIQWGVIEMVIAAGTQGTRNQKKRYVCFGGQIKKIEEDFSNTSSQMMATTIYIHPVGITFAESNSKGIRLLTKSGKVLDEVTVDLTGTKVPMLIDGHDF